MTRTRRAYQAAAGYRSNRDNLIAGAYKPGPDTTGPYTVANWTDVNPSSGQVITISTPGIYYGRRFWGQVRVSVAGVVFRECWFAGPKPSTVVVSDPGIIRNFGANPQKFEIWDSVIDPMPWVAERSEPKLSHLAFGIHGGNIKMYRSEVRNIHDPWNWIGPDPAVASAATVQNQEHLLQQCWVHAGYYENNVVPPKDGQPHADGFQTNFGRNLTIRGNYIGGQRDMTGYLTWPGGYNAGDDFFGAGIMLQQEVSNDDGWKIENVLIEDNWIAGGNHGINHSYRSSLPNDFATTVIRRNKFTTRTGSNWNQSYRLSVDNDTSSPPVQASSGPGTYIIKGTNIPSGIYSQNTNEQTGSLVTISPGGINN